MLYNKTYVNLNALENERFLRRKEKKNLKNSELNNKNWEIVVSFLISMTIYQLLFESSMITFISYYVEAIFISKYRSMKLNMEIVSEINHEILQFDTMIMFAISENPQQ